VDAGDRQEKYDTKLKELFDEKVLIDFYPIWGDRIIEYTPPGENKESKPVSIMKYLTEISMIPSGLIEPMLDVCLFEKEMNEDQIRNHNKEVRNAPKEQVEEEVKE